MDHETIMREALGLAGEAAACGEVPVGCVITNAEGRIVGRGRNSREQEKNALAHAELAAIREACRVLGDWRLHGCSLYVTLEPCPMCAGAIINARIAKLFYGAKDPVTGSCGSVTNLFMEQYGHSPQIVGGIMETECGVLLSDFFERVRNRS